MSLGGAFGELRLERPNSQHMIPSCSGHDDEKCLTS